MRRTLHVLLAVAAVVLALLVDWPQRKRQIARLAKVFQDAISQPYGDESAIPPVVPALTLDTLANGAAENKMLTLPRLWLASAVVIILTAIVLRPLLP